ncbi:MAG: erythromycin esterase family protein [Planctomycetota bacterium]
MNAWLTIALTVTSLQTPNTPRPEDAAAPELVVAEFAKHARALPAAWPAVLELVQDARVIAIDVPRGVAQETIALRAELTRRAIGERGVRSLALDADWTEVIRLDEYLRTGAGEPRALVASMSPGPWCTREFLELLVWMRLYNEDSAHAEKLSIFGLDVADTRFSAMQVAGYFQKVDSASGDRMALVFAPLRQVDSFGRSRYFELSEPERDGLLAQIGEAIAMVEGSREEFVAKSSDVEWELALRAAHALMRAEEIYRGMLEGTLENRRARAMAQNLAEHLERTRARTLVWTHDERAGSESGDSLGDLVRAVHGEKCVLLGATFGRGVAWIPAGHETPAGARALPQAPDGSVEHAFQRIEKPEVFLSLRALPRDGSARSWLAQTHAMRGGDPRFVVEKEGFVPVEPARSYDGLFFLEVVTAPVFLEAEVVTPR